MSLGGPALVYDTIRSERGDNFVDTATCVEAGDGSDTQATDAFSPLPGQVFHYLSRARNPCGRGTPGVSTAGWVRTVTTCAPTPDGGVPDILVAGPQVTVESFKEYFNSGEIPVSHPLTLPVAPVGGGTLELTVEGNYSSPEQFATVIVEGLPVGSLGGTGVDCLPVADQFPVGPSDLSRAAGDGVVDVVVQNSEAVDVLCDINAHTVRLQYRGPIDLLDFGTVAVGSNSDRTILIASDM